MQGERESDVRLDNTVRGKGKGQWWVAAASKDDVCGLRTSVSTGGWRWGGYGVGTLLPLRVAAVLSVCLKCLLAYLFI